jgi:ATP-dependent DNA helicase RecG
MPPDMKRQDLIQPVQQGEGLSLEFKHSTGELRQALETVCGFLNTKGGRIIIGVGPRGEIRGQQVSDQTLQEIAQGFARFEPPVLPAIERIPLGPGLEALSRQWEVASREDTSSSR